jgi:chromosome segregation ATPase
MQDITELEKRITAALERIGKGMDRLSAQPRQANPSSPAPSGQAPAADAALRAQLEEEKALTAQLQARLRAAKEREAKGDLQDKLDRLTQELDVKGLELQRMRRVNASLREQLEALRTAAASGVTEPHLINKAMATELEALRATRLTEIAEMDEILAALEPHLTEAGNA